MLLRLWSGLECYLDPFGIWGLTGPDVPHRTPRRPTPRLLDPAGGRKYCGTYWTQDPFPLRCVALLPSVSAGRIWPIRRVRPIH